MTLRYGMMVALSEGFTLLLPGAKGHHQCGVKLSIILVTCFFKPCNINFSCKLSLRVIFNGRVFLLPSWYLVISLAVLLRGFCLVYPYFEIEPFGVSAFYGGGGWETCIRLSTLNGLLFPLPCEVCK